MDKCAACGRALCRDETALTRKLVNRGARSFYCLSCLAQRFETSEDELLRKIEAFREMGCTLFEQPAAQDIPRDKDREGM